MEIIVVQNDKAVVLTENYCEVCRKSYLGNYHLCIGEYFDEIG